MRQARKIFHGWNESKWMVCVVRGLDFLSYINFWFGWFVICCCCCCRSLPTWIPQWNFPNDLAGVAQTYGKLILYIEKATMNNYPHYVLTTTDYFSQLVNRNDEKSTHTRMAPIMVMRHYYSLRLCIQCVCVIYHSENGWISFQHLRWMVLVLVCAVCINCPQTFFVCHTNANMITNITLHYVCLCVCVQGLSEIVETTLMFDKSLEKHTNYIIIMTPSCNSDNGDGGGNGHGTHWL